jgi:TetR/AcrR family transcriptional regulator, regulator of autoinduction and epiphytic fitness
VPAVKPSRSYVSPLRQKQAKQTQLAVIGAARELFVAQGYNATSVTAVARRAGVSPDTVYAVFGTKSGLLKQVIDVTIAGDADQTPLPERPAAQAIRAEPDGHRCLQIYAQDAAQRLAIAGPVLTALRTAATSAPDVAAQLAEFDRQRLTGMTMLAAELAGKKHITAGADTIRDLLWLTASPECWDLFCRRRGWSQQQWESWAAATWHAALTDVPEP